MEENGARLQSQRMGTMPEGKLLFTMALPMILSMLVQALYNIVDSVYVARVSEDCLSALSLAFPAQNILIGLGTGTGVGVSTLVSRALGARDQKGANRVAGNAFFLCVCCWAVMAIFGLLGAAGFIRSQTNVESIRNYGVSYLRIVTIGSFFVYFEICFERLLQSTGLSRLSMWTQLIGAVTNIILDPFFIFGWCGLPALGTAGAAIATVIGQGTGAAVGLFFHLRKNTEIRVRLSDCRPSGRIIGQVYRIGFPSILMVGISALTNYLMNIILHGFTSTAVAVFGSFAKLRSFVFMPIFGINNGIIPIIGYNFGAGNKKRIYRTARCGLLFASAIGLAGFSIFELFPRTLLGFFSASENMLSIGVPALRIGGIIFLVAGYCVAAESVCQALDNSMASFITSIFRQVVALVPAAWLLARLGNVSYVWWAYPIAEVLSVLFNTLFLKKSFRDMERKLSAREAA